MYIFVESESWEYCRCKTENKPDSTDLNDDEDLDNFSGDFSGDESDEIYVKNNTLFFE